MSRWCEWEECSSELTSYCAPSSGNSACWVSLALISITYATLLCHYAPCELLYRYKKRKKIIEMHLDHAIPPNVHGLLRFKRSILITAWYLIAKLWRCTNFNRHVLSFRKRAKFYGTPITHVRLIFNCIQFNILQYSTCPAIVLHFL